MSKVTEQYVELSKRELENLVARKRDELEELEATINLRDQLQDDVYTASLELARRAVLDGDYTPTQLNRVWGGAINNESIHAAFVHWAESVSTSPQLKVISLQDSLNGSSEFCLVPFEVTTTGISRALIESIENTARELLSSNRRTNNVGSTFFVDRNIVYRCGRRAYVRVEPVIPSDGGEMRLRAWASTSPISSKGYGDRGEYLSIYGALERAHELYIEGLEDEARFLAEQARRDARENSVGFWSKVKNALTA